MPIKNKVEAAAISAAGIIFIDNSTKRLLLIYRSADVVDPLCWCGAGGKIEPGETPEQAAVREAEEEIGFVKPAAFWLRPLYVYNSDKLVFHNFMGILEQPFEPKLNWESSGYAWCEWDKWPQPLHYGFEAILNDPKAGDLLKYTVTNPGA